MFRDDTSGNDLRDRLRRLIAQNGSGFLIDARDHLDAEGVVETRSRAAFRLGDGSLRWQFITLWGLVRHPAMMNECLQGLAEIVTEVIREKGPIDFIVTCSPTGNHLMGHVRARLAQTKIKVPGLYLGLHPLASNIDFAQVKGKKIIFIADVIDNGSLTGLLIYRLNEQGAETAAVLSVVIVRNSEKDPVRSSVRIANKGSGVPLYSLTDFTLRILHESEADLTQLIEIEPGTLLNRVIADRQNGMLLGPEARRNEGNAVTYSPNTVFRLPSGDLQRHLITLWPLFEKDWYFDDCMDALAAKAREIRFRTYFSTIVTCTAVGRHLMEHLQARVETEDRPVEAVYLGPYPYQALTNYGPGEFDGKPVLILVDVIASHRLVTDIASVVHKLGGKIAAVLGVVALEHEEDAKIEKVICYASDSMAPVFNLASFVIQKVKEEDLRGAEVIKVEPETILPEEPESGGERHFQIFDYATTLRHLDTSEAIRIGQFEINTRLFTAGIRLPQLFDVCGAEIWKEIAPTFTGQDLLVTTTDRNDLQFLHFVQQWTLIAQPKLTPLFIHRYDSIDFDFPCFLPGESREQLSGKRVVLLINSLQTSEKLRKLVSLLAQSNVQSISVICLINRMGHHTADFVGRIKRVNSGLNRHSLRENFIFRAIYSVSDLSGVELAATLNAIHRLAAQYAECSGSLVFKSLVEEEMRYFRLRPFLSGHVSQRPPYRFPAAVSVSRDGTGLKLRTWDAVVYAFYSQAQNSRDYTHLIALLFEERDQSRIYLIFVLLLSEVTFLRLTHQNEKLKRTVLEAVRNKRKLRLERETDLGPNGRSDPSMLEAAYEEIFKLVQEETYLLFGLALFSYLDAASEELLPWIREIAMGGFTWLSQWGEFPLNFQVYYGEPRSLWCVSLLLHFAHIEESLSAAQFQKEAQILKQQCLDCLALLPKLEIREVANEQRSQWQNRLKYAFDSLLTDLGFHELRYKHQILRFLGSRLGHRASHHNAITKDIRDAVLTLSRFLRAQPRPEQSEEGPPPKKGFVLPPTGEQSHVWKRAMDKALQASAFLDTVARAARELFGFYPTPDAEKAKRYLAPSGVEGFSDDVQKLQKRLSRIRAEGTVSWNDVMRITEVLERAAKDLDDTLSPLRSAVNYYHQPLISILMEEMDSANKYLSKDYSPVWKAQLREFRARFETMGEVYVLCDPLLLREILWNLFTNVRHGLHTSPRLRKITHREKLSAEVLVPDLTPSGQELRFCKLRITSPDGKAEIPTSHSLTIGRHAVELRQFGGELVTQTGGDQFQVTLTLICREHGKESADERSQEL